MAVSGGGEGADQAGEGFGQGGRFVVQSGTQWMLVATIQPSWLP
ncbi:hypothetical protein BKA01_002947 [Pseudonocardia eucalypti]|nr:hypothetical protein [Pseudonocardia eucalypti]